MRAARLVRRAVAATGAALFLLAIPGVLAQGDRPTVLRAEVNGAITPVVSDYLAEAVARAELDGHDALLVTIDTPGGLDSSMREIVRAFLNASVPVVVWVSPSGAQAASAGAVITLAAHVAAMAPGTNIGAATPVSLEGGEVGDKVINNATAYVVEIATVRGRDTDFARDIVQKGRSEPASRAVRIGAVDLLASDRGELFDALDGREVPLDVDGDETVTLRLKDAAVTEHEMGWVRSVRQRLADPNLAFLFMSLGTLAIVYELASPGIGFGGIVGVILLVLGFFALAVLPVNVAGVVLLLLAAGLFIAELFVPGVGVLAAGGAISLALSGIFLVRGSPRVDLIVILPTVVGMTAGVVVAGRLAWRARRAQPTWGAESLRGRTTTVRRAEGSTGQVLIEGAWWTVRSDEPLEVGAEVLVKDVQGLELMVESAERGQG
ncbi:MAG: NfeD family protein [Actinomycetota bacterium]